MNSKILFSPKEMNLRSVRGFTLIELLIVIAIIGILSVALVAFSANSIRKTQLRDGAVQVLTDLRQARAQAQKTSQGSTITLDSGAVGSPLATYSTQWGGAASSTPRSLSSPIRIAPYTTSPINSGRSISYSAPYGEVTDTGIVWEISSTLIPDKLYVKAVGVTGKVILSELPQ
jgi:prepilin-type N-terminal cleavage/methylation domain-containing protein